MARDDPIIIESDSDTEEEEVDLIQLERDKNSAKRRRSNSTISTSQAGQPDGQRRSYASTSAASVVQATTSSQLPAVSRTASQAASLPNSDNYVRTANNAERGANVHPPSGGSGGGIPMSLSSLGVLGLGLCAMNDRKAMEMARLQRQRQRRRAEGKQSDSDGEKEEDKRLRPPSNPQRSSSSSASSLFGGQLGGTGSVASSQSNHRSRSYITEVNETRSILPPPRTTGRAHGFQDLTTGSETGSSGAGRSRQASALSGLGGSAGSKPALRRILAGDRFWEGTVKRSWNTYTQDGVPFSDLILPSTRHNAAGLTHAIITSYDIDYDWLYTILPSKDSAQPGKRALPGPEFTFLVSEQTGLPVGTQERLHPGWLFHVRKGLRKEEYCRQHIKLFILLYPDRLRLGILTGNMTEGDWSILEDAAYLQDFPLLPGEQEDTTSDSYRQLSMVLSSLGLSTTNNTAFRALSRYDLSNGPTIVASIATDGPVTGRTNVSKVGVGRLAIKSRELLGDPVLAGGLQLEAQGSSMGNYSSKWLQMFHLAASGLVVPFPTSATGPAITRRYQTAIGKFDQEWPPIKIVFPTRDFVLRETCGGPGTGGCHFGKTGDAFDKFKGLCYQAKGARLPGLLMHQKAILAIKPGISLSDKLARAGAIELNCTSSSSHTQKVSTEKGKGREGDEDEIIGWTYLGSANFTKAAWGNLSAPPKRATNLKTTPAHAIPSGGTTGPSFQSQKDSSFPLSNRSQPNSSSSDDDELDVQLTANNWELGVLLPLRRSDLRAEAELTSNARSAICWERPLRPYRKVDSSAGRADVPWIMSERA